MADTCQYCGKTIDGDLATRAPDGRCTCTVCFFEPARMREVIAAAGFDMTMVEEVLDETRETLDTARGREIRRRAKRDAEKGGA